MKNALFLLLLFCFCFKGFSQDIVFTTKDNDLRLSSLPYYNYGKGLGITSPDSIFQFNIRFRMQNRLSYLEDFEGNTLYDGQIRRLRLRFDGYIGDPRFLYAIQLSFAPGDVGEIVEGENVNIIRDAVLFYRPNAKWTILFGQTKLPGNRQRVNSSGALQLTDRTINNARFNIDRDFGIQVHQMNEFADEFSYNFKWATSMGEGRNFTKEPNSGLAHTAKVELFPFGAFTKDGTYFEGDVVREENLKVLFSGVYHKNVNALRTGGQLGNYLFERRTFSSVFVDFMAKYQGWSLMSVYMNRVGSNVITRNPLDPSEFNFVFVGEGIDYQLSYLFKSNYEVIGRYSIQKINQQIREFVPHSKQWTVGVTKYIWEHAFKLQTEFSYDRFQFSNQTTRSSFYFRFQVEMGI